MKAADKIEEGGFSGAESILMNRERQVIDGTHGSAAVNSDGNVVEMDGGT